MGRLLQVTAAGAARFPSTEVRSTAVLYEKKLTTPGYEGFADVKINGDKKVSLTLDADINHLELDTGHAQASREVATLLTEMGFLPHSVRRGGSSVIYFKQSEHIEDLLTTIGARRGHGYHDRQGG